MKNKVSISILVIIVAAILAFWYFHQAKPLNTTENLGQTVASSSIVKGNGNATTSTAISFFCQEGVIQAAFGQSQVTLVLSGGRTLSLPQVESGSGIRYATGTAVFVSKGDNAYLTENNQTTYTNCVAGAQTSVNAANTFTNTGKTFSFSYPAEFNLSGGDLGYTQSWRAEATSSGLLLTVVSIPKSFQPQTNFGETKFTVGTSADPEAVKNCLSLDQPGFGTSTPVAINGWPFTKITFSDAGAGNFYDTTSYRAVYNNQCYAVEYTIHSLNIGNYSPDQHISEFDRAKITALLQSMAESFTFLGQ